MQVSGFSRNKDGDIERSMRFNQRWLQDCICRLMMVERLRIRSSLSCVFLLLLGVMPLSNIANASDIRFTNEVLIAADPGSALEPTAIRETDDGGFILTGSMNFKGWAIKTDADGKILWRYNLAPEIDQSSVQGVKVQGAIPLQDGSAYLFIGMPRSTGSKAPNTLLVHVSVDGKELSRQFLSLPSAGDVDGVYVNDDARCIKWLDGFAYVSYEGFIAAERKSASVGNRIVFPLDKKFYDITFFDPEGRARWQKQVPSAIASTAKIGSLYVSDGKLLFSATDNSSTDVVSIDKTCGVVTRNNLTGSLSLIGPASATANIQMLGYKDSRTILVSMDEALRETGRTLSDLKDFVGRGYQLDDGSYLVVGNRTHTTGENYTTAVAALSAALKVNDIKEFPRSSAPPFLDGGRVVDMTRTTVPGEFVTLRKLTRISSGTQGVGTVPAFQGVAMDFIKIN